LLFFKSNKRITYLLPVATKEAKDFGIPSLLINYLIEKYQKLDLILDFEGSMIPNVAVFYRSFGCELEHYNLLEKRIIFL